MKTRTKIIITGFMTAIVSVAIAVTYATSKNDVNMTLEEKIENLPDHEKEEIAKMEADGYKVTNVEYNTDRQSGFHSIDITYMKDVNNENNP